MIGVFGGSGFYDFLRNANEVSVETPYGDPAAPYMVGSIGDVDVAFLPRHGRDHQYPPHKVPYRANVWGMKELGASCIIGPCAVGSLRQEMAPGHFVVCDQIVDRTQAREGTFFDGPDVQHLSFADPYCGDLRELAVAALRATGATTHDGGTVAVIAGPRFSTRAESAFFAAQGWDLLNMTQVPEVQLTRELGMCYVNISVVTDYDVGAASHPEPVTHEEVLAALERSLSTLRDAVWDLVQRADAAHSCSG
jgi:5'-methylthioadenosine phosphorylase